MDDVTADQQGDAEAAFLHGDPLQFVRDVGVDEIEYRSEPSGPQPFSQAADRVRVARVELGHLADFFGYGHAGEQRLDALVEVGGLPLCVHGGDAHK